MSYRVLVLPQTDAMRPELLRKIRELVAGGAIVVGRKPERSPSLAGYPAARRRSARAGGRAMGRPRRREPHHAPRRQRRGGLGLAARPQ